MVKKIKCIQDVHMHQYNTSGERVRTGIKAFIEGCEYNVVDHNEETHNAIIMNHQGSRHHWYTDRPDFAKHFDILT